ncbi:unnamed protein product [Paramecium sonneborni]|uniref:Uncharacterized protein n=1 Tax=Paramecium sonneborni TaxID=65129 RepID=A0A8S1RKT1_9CILI|nr:unnamed protein product [Paramecium sonneborni]CAD8128798.1 unnamed protein product [Paramecium sonneborni]
MLCAICLDATTKYQNRKANILFCKNIYCYFQFQKITYNHIIQIQEVKNSQLRSILTVQNLREKANAINNFFQIQANILQWSKNALKRRLHSPLRRKQQQQKLMRKIKNYKDLSLKNKFLNKNNKIKFIDMKSYIKPKFQSSPMMKTQFAFVKSKSTTYLFNKQYQLDSFMENSKINDLLKSEIKLSKISKIE